MLARPHDACSLCELMVCGGVPFEMDLGTHTAALWAFPQVVDIMRVNVDKVLERDQKLSELDDRADALQAGASQFETSAAKLKRKYWWKNLKVRVEAGGRTGRRWGVNGSILVCLTEPPPHPQMMIILGVICAIILIIIIGE